MYRLKNSIELEARPEHVFDLLAAPENLPRIWPSMVDVRNVERTAAGGLTFEWLYKMAGVLLRGRATSVRADRGERLELRNEGGIASTVRWSFEARGSGTLLTCEIEYELPQPVLATVDEAIVASANEREQRTLLENVKTVLELAPRTKPNGAGRQPTR